MQELPREDLKELVEELDSYDDDARDELLTDLLNPPYPSKTTQDN